MRAMGLLQRKNRRRALGARKKMSEKKKIFTKEKIFCKRNIIIGVAALLTVAIIVTGICIWISNANKKKFNSTPDFEAINKTYSTAIAAPKDGTTPLDHDVNKNAYYAFGVMNETDSFVGRSEGVTVTKVAFASVNQYIKANRVVNNGEVYKESVSFSKFKGVGVRTFVKGDNYVIHNASKVSAVDNVVWKAEANKVSEETFLQTYGVVLNSITAYIMTDETILSAEYLGEENGIYSYKYKLDPVKATGKISLEMRTMAGVSSLPLFTDVNLTIRMDKNWQVTETVTDCTYQVDMLGGVTCTEALTEVFTDYGKETEIPDAEFYRAYLDAEITEPTVEAETALDYLMNGFGDYISGQKPLKVRLSAAGNEDLPLTLAGSAEIDINIKDLSAISARLAVDDVAYGNVAVSDLFIGYREERVYLALDDFKAYGAIDEMSAVINRLLPIFGVEENLTASLGAIDFESVLKNATLEKDGENAVVSLPLSLGETQLAVQLKFKETDDKITFIQGNVSMAGVAVTLVSDETVSVAAIGQDYHNIAPLFDVIDENGRIHLNVAIGEINALVDFDLNTLSADVGLGDLTARYAEETLYFNYKGLKAKLAVADIEPMFAKLQPIIANFADLSALATLEETVDVLGIVGQAVNGLHIEETDGVLTFSTVVEGVAVAIRFNITDAGYTVKGIDVTIEETTVSVVPTDKTVTAISEAEQANYKSVTGLLDLIDDEGNVSLLLDLGGAEMPVTIDLIDLELYAAIAGAEVYADFNTGDIYARYPGVKATLNFNDVEEIIGKLQPILDKFLGEGALPAIDMDEMTGISVEEILSSLVVTEEANITSVGLSVRGVDVTLHLNTAGEKLALDSVSILVEGMEISAVRAETALSFDFDLSETYVDLKALVDDYGDALTSVLTADSLYVSAGGSIVNGSSTYTITNATVAIDGLSTAPRADARLTLDISETAEDGTVTTTTHEIRLVYLDPTLVAEGASNVYFTYDNKLDEAVFEGTFTTEKAGETLDIVKQIYSNIPELQDLLKPIIVPDGNGQPTFPEVAVDFTKLFNLIDYTDGVLSVDLNGQSFMETLPSSLLAQLTNADGTLTLDIPSLTMDGLTAALNVSLSVPEEGSITDDTFAYTVGANASDFSSINTLLQTLSNTAAFRSFHLTGVVNMEVLGFIDITDKIHLGAKIDIVEELVYAAVSIERENVALAWDDYDGKATLYYDPAEEMIYIKDMSRTRKFTWTGYQYTENYTYSKYTVDEFMADPLTPIMDMMHFSNTIEELILNAEDKTSEVPPTVENTFLRYSYNGTDTFHIDLDLEPMLVDVQDVALDIKHDANMCASGLYAEVGLVSVIDLMLNASVETPYDTYQGVPESIEAEKASGNYA